MQVILELPEELASIYGTTPLELERASLEALVLQGIREDKLTVAQGRRILGIESRYEMDGFLKAHDVMLPYTVEDYKRDGEVALRFSRLAHQQNR